MPTPEENKESPPFGKRLLRLLRRLIAWLSWVSHTAWVLFRKIPLGAAFRMGRRTLGSLRKGLIRFKEALWRRSSETTQRCWSLFSKIGSGVIQVSFLALYAPLVQTEIPIPAWLTFSVAALVILILVILRTIASTRLRPGSLLFSTAVLLIIASSVYLSIKPFFPAPASVYISNSDRGLAVFNPNRYVSKIYDLTPEIRLVEANHPFHHWAGWLFLQLTRSESAPGDHVTWPFRHLRGLLSHRVATKVTFLDRIHKNNNEALPIRLPRHSLAYTYDLNRSQCIHYLFYAEGQQINFDITLSKLYDTADGRVRVGSDIRLENHVPTSGDSLLNLFKFLDGDSPASSEPLSYRSAAIAIAFRQRKEINQWPEVLLYRQYDQQSALYAALLSELLNSPHLFQRWEELQQMLWENAPNDRERLRLLTLKHSLARYRMGGNVLGVTLIPDLRLTEAILNGTVTTAADLAQDQLLYWVARSFVSSAATYRHLFSKTIETFETYLREIESIHEPKFFIPDGLDTELHRLVNQAIPKGFRGKSWLTQFLGSIPRRHDPINQTRHWLESFQWEDIKIHLPRCTLSRKNTSDLPPAIRQLTEPTLEEAWESATNAFALEMTRKILDGMMKRHPKTFRAGAGEIAIPDGATFRAILADLLLEIGNRKDDFEEYVAFRGQLFGQTREAYLAQSPIAKTIAAYLHEFEAARTANLPADAVFNDTLLVAAAGKLLELDFPTPSLQAALRPTLEAHPPLGWASLALARTTQTGIAKVAFAELPRFVANKDLAAASSIKELLSYMHRVLADPDSASLPDFLEILRLALQAVPLAPEPKKEINEAIGHLQNIIADEGLAGEFPLLDEVLRHEDIESAKGLVLSLARIARSDSVLRPTLDAMFGPMADRIAKNTFKGPSLEGYRRVQAAYLDWVEKRQKRLLSDQPGHPLQELAWRVFEYSSLPPEERPHTIEYDPERDRAYLTPHSPMFDEWLQSIQTPPEAAFAKYGYPHLPDAILLDLILRTLEDKTPQGYAQTQLGFPRQIFRLLTGATIEECLPFHLPDDTAPKP